MISYVLVMLVSLSTGQPVHASLEGPMSRGWCEQLIRQDRYNGEDGASRKSPSCLSGQDAQRVLVDSFCTRTPGPSPHWPAIDFDCAPPAPAPAPVSDDRSRGEVPEAAPRTDDSESAPRQEQVEPTPQPQYLEPRPARMDSPAKTSAAGSAQPEMPEPSPPQPAITAAPPSPPTPADELPEQPSPQLAQKHFHLGAATGALVAQAHTQTKLGHRELAAATIERALRIEPENPLLWIELGEVRMGQGNASQADGVYRKALALATGDSELQAAAWILIAESLRARGRNEEAADAERRAASSVPR
jgi:hypothetical protein